MKGPSARARLALAALAAAACLGCHSAYTATDGTRLGSGKTELEAVKASGGHDLRCPPEQLVVLLLPYPNGGHHQYVVDGCGRRATYNILCEGFTDVSCRPLLMSRFSLDPAQP
jgi:hypothetical protein